MLWWSMADSSSAKVNSPASIPHNLHGRRPTPSSVSGGKQAKPALTKGSTSCLHGEAISTLSFHLVLDSARKRAILETGTTRFDAAAPARNFLRHRHKIGSDLPRFFRLGRQ